MIVGTVEEVGPGRWRTENGEPPQEFTSITDVYRLVRFHVDDPLTSDSRDEVIVVAISGGDIGCEKYVSDEVPDEFKVGEQFVLYLNEDSHPSEALSSVPEVFHIWAVDNGSVVTPNEGRVALEEFGASVEKASR